MLRAGLAGLTAGVGAMVAYAFEDSLNNPFGFALLVFGPLLIGLVCSLPEVTAGVVLRTGVTAAICGACVLGLSVAAGDDDGGGLLVATGAGTAFAVVGLLPVVLAALLLTLKRRERV